MNRYYINKVTTVTYSAVVEAESLEEAQDLFEHVDLDDCFCEETCAEIADAKELGQDEIYDLPLIKETIEGYEVLT